MTTTNKNKSAGTVTALIRKFGILVPLFAILCIVFLNYFYRISSSVYYLIFSIFIITYWSCLVFLYANFQNELKTSCYFSFIMSIFFLTSIFMGIYNHFHFINIDASDTWTELSLLITIISIIEFIVIHNYNFKQDVTLLVKKSLEHHIITNDFFYDDHSEKGKILAKSLADARGGIQNKIFLYCLGALPLILLIACSWLTLYCPRLTRVII
jgi:hypothetical protein